MNRAAILIGVSKAGNLQKLQTVSDGIQRMQDWALDQQMSVQVITDENGPVSAPDILKSVKSFADQLTFDQLIIYFTGHGLNVAQNEYWLLSNFPQDTTTVVNVTASREAARTGVIPHVVFISDACRTAAIGTVQQNILFHSMPIFPNTAAGRPFNGIDVFYATLLGNPALEIPDPTGKYHGIYTESLVDALNGLPPITPEPDSALGQNVVRPWPLKAHLKREVLQRFLDFQPPLARFQEPDAIISSDPASWVSIVPSVPVCGAPPPTADEDSDVGIVNIAEISQDALRSALDPHLMGVRGAEPALSIDIEKSNRKLRGEFKTALESAEFEFDTTRINLECGFEVRGANLVDAISNRGVIEARVASTEACRVRLWDNRDYANVLLSFDNERSVLLPALRGFIAGLTFQADDLVNVSYEPSANTSRWEAFLERKESIRHLRAVIAASTRMGTFQLDDNEDAASVAREMQLQKGVDPSMAVYAAYAYRRQGNLPRLEEMANFLRNDLGMVFFDVAMLSGRLKNGPIPRGIAPWGPLLTQGWALMSTFGIHLPEALQGLPAHLDLTSLWTLYDSAGANMLRNYIEHQED